MLQTLVTLERFLSRKSKKIIMILFDILAIYLSIVFSIGIRIGSLSPSEFYIGGQFVGVAVLGVVIFSCFGLYSIVVRFVGSDYTTRVVKAVLAVTLLLQASVFLLKPDFFPRSSTIIFFFVCSSILLLSRATVRYLFKQVLDAKNKKKKVLIYGAGSAGQQIARGLRGSPEYRTIAFVDDNLAFHGQYVAELRVYSADNLRKVISKYMVDEIIIAIPSATRRRKQEIISSLKDLNLTIKSLPGLSDIVGGKVHLSDIREVSVIDLLGRDEVPPDEYLIAGSVKDKVVLVSGAGGSIGSELCRQISGLKPAKLILLDHSEFNLYSITQELSQKNIDFPIVSLLGDVRNKDLLDGIFKAHGIDTVYHAAAYKHVPLVESNFSEGIENNVFGTLNLVRSAFEFKVQRFILISTDKAVRPTNIMGASKRIAELILQAYAQVSTETVFSMVRFGNVLGSSGSVVPLFQSQIKLGGPVTVTHPEVTRYFMTIPEAAQLVIQAGTMASGGEVFVLDMGAPVKIVDLARRMIELSGFSVKDEQNPAGDIEIHFTGLRPGEKLYEELLIGDRVLSTPHPRIMKADEIALTKTELENMFNEMRVVLATESLSSVKNFIRDQKINYLG